MKAIILASASNHKIKEFKSMLDGYEVLSLADIKFFDDIEAKKPHTAHNVLKFCKGLVNYCINKKIINNYK